LLYVQFCDKCVSSENVAVRDAVVVAAAAAAQILTVCSCYGIGMQCMHCDIIHVYLLLGKKLQLQPSIGFTLLRVSTVFTRSAVTPQEVNQFG